MNKFIVASVSVLAISFTSGVLAQDKMEKNAVEPMNHNVTEKKTVKHHAKHKHHKHGALWVNAEAPVVAPCCDNPCAETTCAETTCAETTCAPAPMCEPLPATCVPLPFAGNTSCPYIYHGGYFYYPHPRGTVLGGYTPTYINGSYWYPSYMHPYHVYVQRMPMHFVHPHHMQHKAAATKAAK